MVDEIRLKTLGTILKRTFENVDEIIGKVVGGLNMGQIVIFIIVEGGWGIKSCLMRLLGEGTHNM